MISLLSNRLDFTNHEGKPGLILIILLYLHVADSLHLCFCYHIQNRGITKGAAGMLYPHFSQMENSRVMVPVFLTEGSQEGTREDMAEGRELRIPMALGNRLILGPHF